MTIFSFNYKSYNISLCSYVDSVPYVVKCKDISDDVKFMCIVDFNTRPDAFAFIPKLMSFIDTLV